MKKEAYLKFGSCCRKDNKVYFYNMSFNGFFYLDVRDLSIHFVHRFSNIPIDAERLSVNGSMIYNGEIYFFPNNTNVVMKYNLEEHREEVIPITGFKEIKFGTAGFIQWKDMVYLFPSNLEKGIYRLELQTQKIEKDIELSALFKDSSYCGEIFKTSNDCILLNMYGSNEILEIDLCKKEIIASKTVGEGIQIYTMCFDGHNYWLLQMKSKEIYEWCYESNTLQKYTNEYIDQEEQESIPYANMIFFEKEILVLNFYMQSIARINIEKKTIEKKVSFPENFQYVNQKFSKWPSYYRYDIFEEYVLIYPIWGNMLLIYNKESHQLSGKKVQISEKEFPYLNDLFKKIMLEQKLCEECDDLGTLENFMDIIQVAENREQLFTNENIGRIIYEQC